MAHEIDILTEQVREQLAQAYSILSSVSYGDCYCENEDCTIEEPKCETMKAKKVMGIVDEILTPKPQSFHMGRLTNYPEKVFFDLWHKYNTERFSGNMTLLEGILKPSGQNHLPIISHRDMMVATSVIQWMGTNCGQCFIQEAEQKIKKFNERDKHSLESAAITP